MSQSAASPFASPMRQFFRSSGIMAMLYLGSTGLTFVVGVLLARLLGASGYGAYALAMTTATLAGTVTEFGLPVLAMRETGAARAEGDWSKLRGLLHWSDRAILVLSLLLVGGTYGWFALSGKAADTAYLATMIWAVLLVPFVALGKLRSFVLLALDHTLSSQFPVMILRPALFIAGCLALWWSAGSLAPQGAMVMQVVAAALVMVMVLVLFARHRPPALAKARPVAAHREWLGACLPMGLTEGLRLLQGQLGLLLTGLLASSAQAGLYRVADAVTQMTGLFASVVATAATPMFSRMWRSGDVEGTERIAVLGAWSMLGGAALLGLPLALAGPWIFPGVFGADFAGSVPVFWILWGGSLLSATCGLALALANMTGHHVLSTQSFGVIALVNVGLGAVLIPQAGPQGAALASACGSLAGAAWCSVRLHRRTGLNCTLFNARAPGIALDAARAGRARLMALFGARRAPSGEV